MSEKYVVKVSDEDIETLLELANRVPVRYANETYENGIMYTIDWLFQLDMFEFGESVIDPPLYLDGS